MYKPKIYDGLNERVRNKRKELNLKQKELAVKADLTPETMARLENCLNRPRESTIELIATALGVSTNYLKYGKE